MVTPTLLMFASRDVRAHSVRHAAVSRPESIHNVTQDVGAGSRPKDISYGAAVSLLRGHAFAALENHGRALRCYRAALLADPRCYEAFRVRAWPLHALPISCAKKS